jgi:hypothetical protein
LTTFLIVQPPHTCAMCVSEGGLTNVAAGGPLDVEREIDTLLTVAACTSSSPRLGIRRPQAERDHTLSSGTVLLRCAPVTP